MEKTNHKKIVGSFGENLAVEYIKKKNYIIIGQNVKLGHKEIDIIAKYKEKLIFIEVKTLVKNSESEADDNFNENKLELLKNAISAYVTMHNLDPENIRLDLIAIDIYKAKRIAKVKHYIDIF